MSHQTFSHYKLYKKKGGHLQSGHFLLVGRYWEMIERLRINQFNVTPSAIRRLMKVDEEFVRKHDLSSLKTIGSGITLNCYCMYSKLVVLWMSTKFT